MASTHTLQPWLAPCRLVQLQAQHQSCLLLPPPSLTWLGRGCFGLGRQGRGSFRGGAGPPARPAQHLCSQQGAICHRTMCRASPSPRV